MLVKGLCAQIKKHQIALFLVTALGIHYMLRLTKELKDIG
jgi:hypothetical protein